ncbi:YtrH family sporulation protein [Alkalibacillus haloalkaliphilus]|uniref:Sporulation membrane protein YtrH n=1 Tax=Alkalibacillus haloalkaliphilus TaxID=94136 RepID=A0A511W478_9BACI|nr:YtrH family sporulation protein [Alkalibacillus haloalkaliphilus]MDV2581210.1 YtrH family sporulation protein [Alkalibacillus haloalkaliphilus]GEN45896.1 sporulation membrane protein YtrH [Alkalibacillus haloalkaliphilus]
MEERFIASIIKCFFIAFGVLTGGALFGSLSAYLTGQPPISEMMLAAKKLRIWAIVAAIGGTFDAISTFEKGIFEASTVDLIKQILLIISAMGGVKSALMLISWITQGDI